MTPTTSEEQFKYQKFEQNKICKPKRSKSSGESFDMIIELR
jgi:hypothetical protein